MATRRGSGSAGLASLFGVTTTVLALAGGAAWLFGAPSRSAAALGGPWTLSAPDGRTVSDRDFRGRFLLIYFGYASCRDVCPTALGTVAAALRRLGPRAAAVQPVFITLDPDRDTPDTVRRYAERFGPNLIGLTGTAAQLDAVRREYHVERIVHHDPEHGEEIDHTSVLFLVGPDGRTLAPLTADDTPQRLARRLSSFVS